jgi:hypothetical protein
MRYDPQKHHRRSIRLPGYDYSQPGAYFVTICAQDGECLFGEIVDGEMRLSAAGEMVWRWWQELDCKYPSIETDRRWSCPTTSMGSSSLPRRRLRSNHLQGNQTQGNHTGLPRPIRHPYGRPCVAALAMPRSLSNTHRRNHQGNHLQGNHTGLPLPMQRRYGRPCLAALRWVTSWAGSKR